LKHDGFTIDSNASWTVAFTPKGGCPLKRSISRTDTRSGFLVAFTPKGGCPLKQAERAATAPLYK